MYVTDLSFAEAGKTGQPHIPSPAEPDIEKVLNGLQNGRIVYATFSKDDDAVLTVHAQSSCFGAAVFYGEEQAYRLWNGAPESETLIPIGTDEFPKHFVVEDSELIREVILCFCLIGDRSKRAKWLVQDW
jgi:hypothetical protein